jgi:hypothetical protein
MTYGRVTLKSYSEDRSAVRRASAPWFLALQAWPRSHLDTRGNY